MRPFLFAIICLAFVPSTQAQLSRLFTRTKKEDAQKVQKDAREAAARLSAARKSTTTEASSIKESQAKDQAAAAKIDKAAQELLREPDPKETAAAQKAQQSLDTAVNNLSAEGKALLAQSSKTGPTVNPRPEIVEPAPGPKIAAIPPGATAPLAPAPAGAPKPVPIRQTTLENPEMKGNKVIVTCTGAAFFDAEKSIAIFTDNVEVRHPQFFVSCDEFEVHMIQQEKPAADARPKPGDPITATPAPAPANAPAATPPKQPETKSGGASDSNIKMAIARGRRVIIEKLTETGDVQVGQCRHATYVGATGDILMRDFPQVQRGQHLQIATDPSTRMTLKQNGALQTDGPSRTEILQDPKPKGGTHLNSPPPPATGSPNTVGPSQP